MNRFCITWIVISCTLLYTATVLGQDSSANSNQSGLFEQDGIEMSIGVTNVWQRNLKGGLRTSDRSGEFSGSYDLEVGFDLDTLFDTPGIVFMHMEGSWPDEIGIDGDSIGSIFGVNDAAGSGRWWDIVELWYEGKLWDTVTFRAGKIDLTGGVEFNGFPAAFDGSAFANDETTQFLNGALVNNPAIPFPDEGLGLFVFYELSDSLYFSAAAADAKADATRAGFSTTFDGNADFIYLFETGMTAELDSARGPLAGAYRIGMWYDPQAKSYEDGGPEKHDDTGFYLSFDQMILKENDLAEDSQGAGMFFRYGYADEERNALSHFWSLGVRYQGLIENRDEDVAGFGFAQGRVSDLSSEYTQDDESVFEAYYNAYISDHLQISPSLQYVIHPGAVDTPDAVIAAVRVQMVF